MIHCALSLLLNGHVHFPVNNRQVISGFWPQAGVSSNLDAVFHCPGGTFLAPPSRH